MAFNPEFFNVETQGQDSNLLLQYLKQQHPDVLEHVARSASPEIKQIVAQNVQGIVGMLPSEDFEMQIVTDRENMANLLASAMMTGYFLRQMEQRMTLDEALLDSGSLDSSDA